MEISITTLVNKDNPLKENFVPDNLSTLASFCSESDKQLIKEAKIQWEILCTNACKEGMNLKVVSAYRSFEYQQKLFDYYVKTRGLKYASKCSAKPGYSEHQTGLAIDVMGENGDYNLFQETKEFNWMNEHAYEYGFILRYPKDKEKITGYKYEPWHYRYVGKELAAYLFHNDLTMEEYFLKEPN